MFNFSNRKKDVFAHIGVRLKWNGSMLMFIWFVQLVVTWLSDFPLVLLMVVLEKMIEGGEWGEGGT